MSAEANKPDLLSDKLYVLLATVFGVGFVPKAPGTAASLVTLPLAGWLAGFGLVSYLTVSVIFVIVSIPICGRAAKAFRQEDPHCIVLDEVAGMLLAFAPFSFIHIGRFSVFILFLLISFAWFRFFDIKKPMFVNRLQEFHGGAGIVLDDVGAGVLAAFASASCFAAWQKIFAFMGG